MKILEYYFAHEFQWLNEWFSKTGLSRAIIRPSKEFLSKNKYVDYSVIERLFYETPFQSRELFENEMNQFNKNLAEGIAFRLSTEWITIEINQELSCILATLEGDWENSTPKEFQCIPTNELVGLLNDWLLFLRTVEKCSFKLH